MSVQIIRGNDKVEGFLFLRTEKVKNILRKNYITLEMVYMVVCVG
jgi:hypothetical protein